MNARFLLLIFFVTSLGCSAAMKKSKDLPKESTDLRYVVSQFHLKMRWGQWEQASAYVEADYRSRFLGRYEEYGEDYKITDLEVKTVKVETAELSNVEVEQQWYKEPNMTVQKERFMEVWQMTDVGWRLKERPTKDIWREKQKEEAEKPVKDPDGPTDEVPTEPTAEIEPTSP